MTGKDFIGHWFNKEIELILKPNHSASIMWNNSKKSGIGMWKLDGKNISISYSFKGIEQFTSEFKLNGKKYGHEQIFSIISFDKSKIEVIDNNSLNKRLELINNQEKTNELFRKEERKEDLLQAYVMMLLISAVVGPLIRWIINPDIPTWVLIATTFLICLIFIRRI